MKIGNTSIWDMSTRIPQIYGTLIFLGLLAYFFIAYLFKFVHMNELRLLNLPILLAGVYFALRQYRRTHGWSISYFQAFTRGAATAAIGTLTFATFLLVYLHIDAHLMAALAERQPLGIHLNPYIISFTISIEGIFSGVFAAFLFSNFMATGSKVPGSKPASEIIQ